MKKLIKFVVITCTLIITFSSPLIALDKPMKIKFAYMGNPDLFKDVGHASASIFKKLVESGSGGRIEVELYPAGVLGNETDSLESTKRGVIQIFSASLVALNRIYPPSIAMSSPYLFKNLNVAWEVTRSDYANKMLNDFTEKTGIQGLAIFDLGFNAISNSVKPLRNPSDFKGIKFRGMGRMQVEMFESLGAAAVPISWTEVYTSLQTGVVNGQTNPPGIIYGFKLYEVQKYLSLANSQYAYQFWVANKQWYDSVTPQDKILIRDAIESALYSARGIGIIQDQNAIEELKKLGVQVDALSNEEITEFQKIARPKCLEWLRTQMDPKWIDELLVAIEKTEKKLGYK
jgi:TRAP-type transport system periplasmic protein